MKKYISLILRIVISFGLIGYFLYALSRQHGGLAAALEQFKLAFSSVSVIWLIPAFLLHLLGFTLVSLRWKILLRAQAVESRFRQLFLYYIMASFFNTFLPSTIGGDTLRAVESKKLTGNTSTSVMVVIIERLTGLMALVLISACGLFIIAIRTPETPGTVWFFLVGVVSCFIAAVICTHQKIARPILLLLGKYLPEKVHRFLEQAYEAVLNYYRHPASLFSALGVSVIFQLNMVLYYYLLAVALNQNPDPVEFMMKVPIMIFLLMTVPAINGLGVRTAGFKGLMSWPAAYALAIEFIDLAFRITYGLIGGLLFLIYRPKTSKVFQPPKGQ